MKKLIVLLALVCAVTSSSSYAQVSISLNIGAQPAWGPVGYDRVDYYYIPDADAYYDVNRHVFVYEEGNRWIDAPELPGRYRNVDLYTVHKVVVNEPRPWMHNDVYRKKYAHYRGMHDQHAIRDSHEERYYQNPGNAHHADWEKQHGHDMNHDYHDGHHDNRGNDHHDHH